MPGFAALGSAPTFLWQYATDSAFTTPLALKGATVTADVYMRVVITTPSSSVSSVDLYTLNAPSNIGDTTSPYTVGAANAIVPLITWAPGLNTVHANVMLADGRTFTTSCTFTTPGSPLLAIVTGPSLTNLTSTTESIGFLLSGNAILASVHYSTAASNTLDQTKTVTVDSDTFTFDLTGLTPATQYRYYATFVPSSGPTLTTQMYTFTTLTQAQDTKPPQFSGVNVSALATSATFNGVTNELAKVDVQFGTSTAYGNQTSAESSFTTNPHALSMTGLPASTTIHYRYRGTDQAGNVGYTAADGTTVTDWSPDATFTTNNLTGGGDLSTYLRVGSGQTVSASSGNLTNSTAPHTATSRSQWTYIVAPSPGATIVVDPVSLWDQSKIAFVGFHVKQGVSVGKAPGTSPDHPSKVAFWYCEMENGYLGQTDGGAQDSHGIQVSAGSEAYLFGCNVHNTYSDAYRVDGGRLHVIGCRQWDAQITWDASRNANDHVDGLQLLSGYVEMRQSVLGFAAGLDPTTRPLVESDSLCGPDKNANATGGPTSGHQGQANIWISGQDAPASFDLDTLWVGRVGGGAGDRIVVDIRALNSTATGTLNDVWTFAYHNDNNAQNYNTSGVTFTGGNQVVHKAVPSGTAPDLLWQAANPIGSYASYFAAHGL